MADLMDFIGTPLADLMQGQVPANEPRRRVLDPNSYTIQNGRLIMNQPNAPPAAPQAQLQTPPLPAPMSEQQFRRQSTMTGGGTVGGPAAPVVAPVPLPAPAQNSIQTLTDRIMQEIDRPAPQRFESTYRLMPNRETSDEEQFRARQMRVFLPDVVPQAQVDFGPSALPAMMANDAQSRSGTLSGLGNLLNAQVQGQAAEADRAARGDLSERDVYAATINRDGTPPEAMAAVENFRRQQRQAAPPLPGAPQVPGAAPEPVAVEDVARIMDRMAFPRPEGQRRDPAQVRTPIQGVVESMMAEPRIRPQDLGRALQFLQNTYNADLPGATNNPSFQNWFTQAFPQIGRNDTPSDIARRRLVDQIVTQQPGSVEERRGFWDRQAASYGARGGYRYSPLDPAVINRLLRQQPQR